MEQRKAARELDADKVLGFEELILQELFNLDKEAAYLSIRRELVSFGIKRESTLNRMAFFWLRVLLYGRNPRLSTRPVGLLLGSTGSGKTYVIKRLCEKLSIPHFLVDCSGLVGSGFVGACIPDIITQAFIEMGAPSSPRDCTGILVFDEVHALSGGLGYSLAVKRELLAILAGEPVFPTEDRNIRQIAQERKLVLPAQIPTINFVPLLIGSFDGTLTRRQGTTCGFKESSLDEKTGGELSESGPANLYRLLEQQCQIPGELLGRINLAPIVFDPPTREDLLGLLTLRDERNPLHALVHEDLGLDFRLSEKTKATLLEQAISRGLGYRSLRQVCEEYIADHLTEFLKSAGLADVVL